MNGDDLPSRVIILETKVGRIESDIESEKNTRGRANDRIAIDLEKISQHLSKQDKLIWIGMGAVGVIQLIVLPILFAIFSKK